MKDQNSIPIPGVGDEKIIYIARRHWASMIGTFFLVLAMILSPLILVITAKSLDSSFLQGDLISKIMAPIAAVYYLVMITYAFVEWVNFYYSLFVLTEDEIIDINQTGFFSRLITQISIIRVQDVSASIKGFWPTLFGYGDVIAESAGEKTQTYIIEKIPKPMEVADKIIEIHDCQVRRERNNDNVSPFRENGTGPGSPCKTAPLVEIRPQKPIAPISQDLSSHPQIPTAPQVPKIDNGRQGEVSQDDLNKGGEIKL